MVAGYLRVWFLVLLFCAWFGGGISHQATKTLSLRSVALNRRERRERVNFDSKTGQIKNLSLTYM